MNYEVGKKYVMKAIGIRKDSAGYDYIALQDDDPNREYRVYNILKCQNESLPEQIHVVVKSIDPFGKIKFLQDEEWLNKDYYKVGGLYSFEVVEVKEDFNTESPYYVIEDDYTSHRYYFKKEQKYQVGDTCILEIKGFSENGRVKFKEPSRYQVLTTGLASAAESQEQESCVTLPVLDVADECQTVEFKRSIAFPPDSNGIADIDKQLKNILRELTAFMNADGGVLYIGIHDKTKKIVGIANDYAHLNDEGKDTYSAQYKQDHDGYELKIRNTVDRLCQSVANSLLSISFEQVQDREYCKIEVKPARRPIFISGSELYVRQGNRTKLIKGDEITFFITERMTISVKEMLDTDDIATNNNPFDLDALKQMMRFLINERRAVPLDLPKPKSLGEIDYWIIWYNNGNWKRSRNESTESDVHIQVPVYKNLSDPIVVFCYETGKVNTVKLSTFRKGANLNALQTRNGWSRTGDIPKNVFIAHATDYLVGYSVDANNIESVKLHAISDYTTTASAANQGSPFLPDTSKILSFFIIGSEHKKRIAHLIVTKAKRAVEAGTPLSSPALKDEIEYLEATLKQ